MLKKLLLKNLLKRLKRNSPFLKLKQNEYSVYGQSILILLVIEKIPVIITMDVSRKALLSIYQFISLKKVLVGMSWGVDSAIAAYLLQQQWYHVVAGFMKNYVSDSGNCTTYSDAEEAIKVAKFLWIEIISFDLQKEYNEKIIEYIYNGYQQGITPNPDVLCNSLIKFDVFLQKALDLWFDAIATGHYARIVETPKR